MCVPNDPVSQACVYHQRQLCGLTAERLEEALSRRADEDAPGRRHVERVWQSAAKWRRALVLEVRGTSAKLRRSGGDCLSPKSRSFRCAGRVSFVSRAATCAKAMEVFPISLDQKVCADIGASTGGFDCMLRWREKSLRHRRRLRSARLKLRSVERVAVWRHQRALHGTGMVCRSAEFAPSTFRSSLSIKLCRRCFRPCAGGKVVA
jgi:hypothetical protein